MKDAEWDDIIQTNLSAIFNLRKAAVRGMMKQRFGRTHRWFSGRFDRQSWSSELCHVKAGVIGFSKSMAREVASRGITVNVVVPGFIDTDMTKVLTDEQKAEIFKDSVNRLGQPQEIAVAVAFLATESATYITGETLHVNGGMHMS